MIINRRRNLLYKKEILEAFPLVAPVHENGTYLTPDEIAAQLGSVNIINKYNQSGIPNKKYAYTINNSLTTFTTPNIDGDFWYYEKVGGIEQKTKYGRNVAVTPTSGSIDRYVVACGNMTQANCASGGEYLFTGKCISVNGSLNSSLLYIYHNRIEIINSFQRSSLKGSLNLTYKSILSIGTSSFNNCNNIESVYIGNNIINFGINAFSDSKNIKSVFIEEGLVEIPLALFQGCIGLNNVVIPNNISSIGAYAFDNCSNLVSVNIPQSIISINTGVFRGAGINDMYLNWDSDNILNYNTFWSLNAKNVTLHIPQGTTELYAAKGYTIDVFGTIIDDIIIE